MKLYDQEGRRAQLKIRESEAATLVDEIVQDKGKALLKRLGFSEQVEIDTSRLIITGHSFGGITAINLAKSD
jgi:dipeptidyl aminopeptidase/acylaminoacyl peptidase